MFSAREAGVAILFHPSLEIEIKISVIDVNGRLIQTEAVFCNQTLNLVNVYAPSGGTNVQRRREFFDSLSQYIDTVDDSRLNIIGDILIVLLTRVWIILTKSLIRSGKIYD
jgi:exonuclease III